MITTEQHAQILDAYLSRLTLSDLNALVVRKKVEMHAMMNSGASSQRFVAEKGKESLKAIVEGILPHDQKNIEMIVTRTFEESIIRKGRSKNQQSDPDMSPG